MLNLFNKPPAQTVNIKRVDTGAFGCFSKGGICGNNIVFGASNGILGAHFERKAAEEVEIVQGVLGVAGCDGVKHFVLNIITSVKGVIVEGGIGSGNTLSCDSILFCVPKRDGQKMDGSPRAFFENCLVEVFTGELVGDNGDSGKEILYLGGVARVETRSSSLSRKDGL